MTLPEPIDLFISNQLGIDYRSIGQEALKNLISTRRNSCNFSSNKDYFNFLIANPNEFDTFKEGLLVPETWFFRDTTPFEFLTDWANPKRKSFSSIKILSIPCATGEEPYSISFALIHSGWRPENLTIFACDISHSFIQFAKKGIYSQKSFRDQDIVKKNLFFDPLDQRHFSVKELYRNPIHFQTNNIISNNLFNNSLHFDVIFARNLLIYFTDEGRQKAIDNIQKLLSPNGLLILGHADNIFHLTNNLKKTGPPGAFAYLKTISSTTHNDTSPTLSSPNTQPAKH